MTNPRKNPPIQKNESTAKKQSIAKRIIVSFCIAGTLVMFENSKVMYVWPKTTIIKLKALNPLKIVKLGSGFLKVVNSFQL